MTEDCDDVDETGGKNEIASLSRRLAESEAELRRLDGVEDRLTESESIRRSLIEFAPTIVIVVDSDGRVMTANRAWPDMTSVKHMLGRTVYQYFSASDRKLLRECVGRVMQARQPEFVEVSYGDREDKVFIFEAHVSPVIRGDQVVALILNCRDISASGDAAHMPVSSEEAPTRADSARNEFLAVMSHELRTPLNSILGFASLLREEALTDSQSEYIEILEASGERLMRLVSDLLDFSRIEAGGYTISKVPMLVLDCLRSVVHDFEDNARKKGVDLKIRESEDMPPSVVLDPDAYRQIILNLVNNALKFTESGSVELALSIEDLDEENEWGRLILAVRDTGIGIPADQLSNLFKPFSRIAGTGKFEGTGLGLSICKRLSNLMGGDIIVESEPGAGTTFTVTIPVEYSEHQEDAGVTNTPHPAVSGAGEFARRYPFKILAVENDRNNLDATIAILKHLGYRPDVAHDGREAIMAVQSSSYDLVLMDIWMPGVNGLDATREIRRMAARATNGRPLCVT